MIEPSKVKRRNPWGSPCFGWGPFRFDWYSICSRGYSPDCPVCKTGRWVNDWIKAFDNWVFKNHYRTWFWWHNRPNSASRRRLKKIFPNLRRKS